MNMETNFDDIEEKLVAYFAGELSAEDRLLVESWRQLSPENEKHFRDLEFGWNALPLLNQMESFDSFAALTKINQKIDKREQNWFLWIQRIAAVLIVPVLIYSAYISIQHFSLKDEKIAEPILQTVSSRQGMVCQFTLEDGTKVWLNSGSTLEFPTQFTGLRREVKLTGEAYFEVAHNEQQPFEVNAHKLNIKVLGTSFDVASYEGDSVSEIVLVTGKVNLSASDGKEKKHLGTMTPGQKSVFNAHRQKTVTEQVEVEKYITWRDGNLIFRDDPMSEVTKRLSRWFNVEIEIVDKEIADYVYTATFRKENLQQVLNLLSLSAPISYKEIKPKALPNGEFSKQKIYLMKKKK
jgi:transmembrane sensor